MSEGVRGRRAPRGCGLCARPGITLCARPVCGRGARGPRDPALEGVVIIVPFRNSEFYRLLRRVLYSTILIERETQTACNSEFLNTLFWKVHRQPASYPTTRRSSTCGCSLVAPTLALGKGHQQRVLLPREGGCTRQLRHLKVARKWPRCIFEARRAHARAGVRAAVRRLLACPLREAQARRGARDGPPVRRCLRRWVQRMVWSACPPPRGGGRAAARGLNGRSRPSSRAAARRGGAYQPASVVARAAQAP